MSSPALTSSAPADPRAGPGRLAGTPEPRRRVETLDWLAEPHLAAWRRGLLDDDSLRRKLAELIAESDVPSAVAHRVCAFNGRGFDARLHADLTEKLRTLLVDKMLPPSTTFSPRKASSIRGWAWNLASTAAVYQRRDLRRFYERFQLLASSDLTTVSSDRRMASMTGATAPTDPKPWDLDTCADVADAIQTLAKPDRQLVHLQAEALLTGLGLPSLQRIPQLADRERVTNLLEADPSLALRSLNVWLAAATPQPDSRTRRAASPTGTAASAACASSLTSPANQYEHEPAAACEPVDLSLLSLWDQFNPEQAGRLVSCAGSRARRLQVAHTVAVAATCPLPRPALKRIRTFVSAVAAAAKDRDEAVREVAAAFVETECEPVARRATMHIDIPGVLERHQRLKESFERHLAAVAALDSDLGRCPADVRD
ncbi:MAG TPA: hypothetical protein VIT65_09520, partial [Microlunatus sp.]